MHMRKAAQNAAGSCDWCLLLQVNRFCQFVSAYWQADSEVIIEFKSSR